VALSYANLRKQRGPPEVVSHLSLFDLSISAVPGALSKPSLARAERENRLLGVDRDSPASEFATFVRDKRVGITSVSGMSHTIYFCKAQFILAPRKYDSVGLGP
jgi:hypothetical protein